MRVMHVSMHAICASIRAMREPLPGKGALAAPEPACGADSVRHIWHGSEAVAGAIVAMAQRQLAEAGAGVGGAAGAVAAIGAVAAAAGAALVAGGR